MVKRSTRERAIPKIGMWKGTVNDVGAGYEQDIYANDVSCVDMHSNVESSRFQLFFNLDEVVDDYTGGIAVVLEGGHQIDLDLYRFLSRNWLTDYRAKQPHRTPSEIKQLVVSSTPGRIESELNSFPKDAWAVLQTAKLFGTYEMLPLLTDEQFDALFESVDSDSRERAKVDLFFKTVSGTPDTQPFDFNLYHFPQNDLVFQSKPKHIEELG